MTGRKQEYGVRNTEQGPALYRPPLGNRAGCPDTGNFLGLPLVIRHSLFSEDGNCVLLITAGWSRIRATPAP